MLVQSQLEAKLIEVRQCELLTCTKGYLDRWFEHASSKFKLDKYSLSSLIESEYANLTLFVLLKSFYNVKENVIVVPTNHFDLLCNDNCFTDGRIIITILGGWQVSSANVS